MTVTRIATTHSPRVLARTTGALYLVTFATSIPALALKRAYLDSGDTALLTIAVVLELALAAACVGTAVAFAPIGLRLRPALAIGFVASRVVEATLVVGGVIALLALATVRDAGVAPGGASGAGAGEASVGLALVAVHDGAFLLGPGLLPAANAVLFGTILLRARLVPRAIPLVGLIGAPLLLASAVLTVAGVLDQVSPLAGLLALPIALWEFAIGVWLLVRGVRDRAQNDAADIPD